MANISVSSNPSTSGNTLVVPFTTDATNITDIQISNNGGSSYVSAISFNSTSATFDVSSWNNGTYTNCMLKCIYTEQIQNLLSGVALTNAYIDNADGSVKTEWAGSNVGSTENYIAVEAGVTYSLNATGDISEMRCAFYTSDYSYIECYEQYSTAPPYSITIPSAAAYIRIHFAVGSGTYSDITNLSLIKAADGGTSGGGSTTIDLTATILNMQYASAHEVLPNAPIDDVWKDKPRQGKGSTIPVQSCTECASGTHTASESYSAGNLWSTFGQWATIYKIKDTELVENVGVEITDFKMWRYNENTNLWVLVNDTFDYGAFYYESFWDDGSAPLNDHKILSSDKKTYKCLMDSQTSGRCFHPFSAQKKWSDYGFTTNPCYVISQMKARLIVWDESGADNRTSANLCMDVGGDYWIRQGASFDSQWRHNSDIAIGYYKKITPDWQYVYMTTCPQDWDKGFPCDFIVK